MYLVRFYNGDVDKQLWDHFVRDAGNGCFLFFRDYMDYHQDRFNDRSLMVFSDENLVAILPANSSSDKTVLHSHQGLTFGGLVTKVKIPLSTGLEIMNAMTSFAREAGFQSLVYKPLPTAFRKTPSEFDGYFLFLKNARLIRRDTNFLVFPEHEESYQERRLRMIKKAAKNNIQIKQTLDFDRFWNEVLTPVLEKRHLVKPVHNLEEIQLLQKRFPEKIRFYGGYMGEQLMAGAVVYDYDSVVHSQYIATIDEGRNLGALDAVFDCLIRETRAAKKVFSFGIANENQGRVLNSGLAEWKEGFGSVVAGHDFWEIDLAALEIENSASL